MMGNDEEYELEAIGYKLLIEVKLKAETSSGGIILASDTIERENNGSDIGTVIGMGPVAYKHERLGNVPWVKIGDKVKFVKYSGVVVDVDSDKIIRSINDEDVYCKVIYKSDKKPKDNTIESEKIDDE